MQEYDLHLSVCAGVDANGKTPDCYRWRWPLILTEIRHRIPQWLVDELWVWVIFGR